MKKMIVIEKYFGILMVKFFAGLFLLFAIGSCKTKSQSQKLRSTADDLIVRISERDTVNIFKLVDTSAFYRTIGKENLLSVIENISERMRLCDKKKFDEIVSEEYVKVTNTIRFEYKFCRTAAGNIDNESFDVFVTLALYEESSNVTGIEFIDYKVKPEPVGPISIPSVSK